MGVARLRVIGNWRLRSSDEDDNRNIALMTMLPGIEG